MKIITMIETPNKMADDLTEAWLPTRAQFRRGASRVPFSPNEVTGVIERSLVAAKLQGARRLIISSPERITEMYSGNFPTTGRSLPQVYRRCVLGAFATGNERLAGTGINLPHEGERMTL